MFPELTDPDLEQVQSPAEAKVYRALRDRTSPDYEVHYSVAWIMRDPRKATQDGEGDFLVCKPSNGFITLEVKGGGIRCNGQTGQWFSLDRHGQTHQIKDPFRQAVKFKYSVLDKLQEHPKWRFLDAPIGHGHAVFFPDLGSPIPLRRPEAPSDVIGCAPDLDTMGPWLQRVEQYWKGLDDRIHPLGQAGVQLIRDLFARSFEVKPLLSAQLADEEQARIRLTEQQIRVLDLLHRRRRAAIFGGAGTGKTVLAVEKAQRLAREGFYTLLTCYNRLLADHLKALCASVENLEVMSFHQLCMQRVREANAQSGRDLFAEAHQSYPEQGTQHEFDVLWPAALAFAVDILDRPYDAIVCDEGQDFRDEYWMPLELLLAECDQSPLYIFFDDNQNLYHRAATFPIQEEPFCLDINCRNTQRIHEAAYRYYQGVPVQPPPILGQSLQILTASSLSAQAKRLQARLVELLQNDGIAPDDLIILIANAKDKRKYYNALRTLPLPRFTQWQEEAPQQRGVVRLDTVNRFKGLEASIVFLWGLDGIDAVMQREVLYVGMTRAKSLVYLVGQEAVCRQFIQGLAQPVP